VDNQNYYGKVLGKVGFFEYFLATSFTGAAFFIVVFILGFYFNLKMYGPEEE
jgi:hypothetical protein